MSIHNKKFYVNTNKFFLGKYIIKFFYVFSWNSRNIGKYHSSSAQSSYDALFNQFPFKKYGTFNFVTTFGNVKKKRYSLDGTDATG